MATILSIAERSNINKVSIFPNPSSGVFTLAAYPGDEVLITIFDMEGKMVHSVTTTSGQQVNVNDLPNGVYVLTVKKGETTATTRLTILK